MNRIIKEKKRFERKISHDYISFGIDTSLGYENIILAKRIWKTINWLRLSLGNCDKLSSDNRIRETYLRESTKRHYRFLKMESLMRKVPKISKSEF